MHLNTILEILPFFLEMRLKHSNQLSLCVCIYLYNSHIEGVFKVSILLALMICVILGSKRCRTNRSRALLLQGVIVIAETSTVLKVLRFEVMFWNCFGNFYFYFFLVLVMENGSDLNQTDRFRRIELPNFSDQVEEIPEPTYSGFVKLRNTVGKDHFLRRWAMVDFIYRVNKFLLKQMNYVGHRNFQSTLRLKMLWIYIPLKVTSHVTRHSTMWFILYQNLYKISFCIKL
jgi:hypothetical protein